MCVSTTGEVAAQAGWPSFLFRAGVDGWHIGLGTDRRWKFDFGGGKAVSVKNSM